MPVRDGDRAMGPSLPEWPRRRHLQIGKRRSQSAMLGVASGRPLRGNGASVRLFRITQFDNLN